MHRCYPGAMRTHVMDGDIARMRPVQAVDVPLSETVVFRPGGLHIMLVDFEEGESFPLTLVFERSGRVRVDASFAKAGSRDCPRQMMATALGSVALLIWLLYRTESFDPGTPRLSEALSNPCRVGDTLTN